MVPLLEGHKAIGKLSYIISGHSDSTPTTKGLGRISRLLAAPWSFQ